MNKYFNNEIEVNEQTGGQISLDSFFEGFKQYNKEYRIPDMKYQFKKRCNIYVSQNVYCMQLLFE